MSTFVLVMFWVYLFCAVITFFTMIGSEYPRAQKPVGIGFDCARLIIHIAFVAWCSYLLWANQP